MLKIQQALDCCQRHEFQMALKLLLTTESKKKKLTSQESDLLTCIKSLCYCKLLQFDAAREAFAPLLAQPIPPELQQYAFYIGYDLKNLKAMTFEFNNPKD